MTSDARTAMEFPARKIMPGLIRDPIRKFEEIGRRADGRIARLNLGLIRPYLLTDPDHLEHVLRTNTAVYARDGMMWEPLRRLVGRGIASEGSSWKVSRELLQPLFSGRQIARITDQLAETIQRAVEDLEKVAGNGPVDAWAEMTRIVQRAIIFVFFGNRIALPDADRIAPAIADVAAWLPVRMLLPFVPHAIPLPGDGAFRRAGRTVDEVMFPIVQAARRAGDDGSDVVSILLRARDRHGNGLTDQQIRDELVSMFLAGSESTAVALTWLWVVLDAHPEIARRLYDEIDDVVGGEMPQRSHLAGLRYTKMVLEELLRMYSVGWVVPRTAVADDVIDGVPVKAGSTIVISPYLTHRLDKVWPRPHVFDPERFGAQAGPRHKLAYMAFGAGPHQCLGSHFFTVEAQLIVAATLSRFRPELRTPPPIRPRAALTLRPRHRVDVLFRPRERARTAGNA